MRCSLLSRGHWFLEVPVLPLEFDAKVLSPIVTIQRNQVDDFMVPCSMLCIDVTHRIVSHLLALIVTQVLGAIEALVREPKVTLFGVSGDSP